MRRILVSTVVLLIIVTLGSAQTPAQRGRRSPEETIRVADQQWLRVFAAKDLKNSVAFCTTDGSVLAPNAPIATGHEEIKKLFAGFFALPDLKISWKPTRIQVARSGELGYSSGAYKMDFNDPSGKPISDRGKYVTVWKKQKDGSWKVLLDIFNSDLQAPAA